MHTTARMPWICAASATPCAWLPADEQTTPRRFCSSGISANLFSGPRILYEPTRWNISAFSRTSKPVRSLQLPRGQQRRALDVRRDARADFLEVPEGEAEHHPALYSFRSATAGSTREARSDGTTAAVAVASSTMSAPATYGMTVNSGMISTIDAST